MQLGPKYKLVGVAGLWVEEGGGEWGVGVQLSVLGFAMWVTYQWSKPANNLQKKEKRKSDGW